MKKISIPILLFCLIISQVAIAAKTGKSDKLRIATYNIRLETTVDSGARAWKNRKKDVARIITSYDFDIFGVQEVGNKNQEAELKKMIPEYNYFGKGRDNQQGTAGEQIGIFFKSTRFELKNRGSFFLSETPDTISKGWDAAFRRMCVWEKLSDKNTGEEFFVFCTHFDHMGVKARVESAKLIVERVRKIAGELPVFFVGDLNTSPEATEMYKILTTYFKDSREIVRKQPTGSIGTFNGYDVSKDLLPVTERIDYIFCNKINVLTYNVINKKYNNKTFPSDHFPLMIECEIATRK
jgi:endonuclease/exonuclease/phosphatase family metal-dependent hydrolase